MEDARIIELYWQRDPQAIESSKVQYGKQIYRIAMGILRNHEDSEECENDTYFSAWCSIPPIWPDSLFAYLAKICRNGALSILDRKQAQKRRAELLELSLELQSCIPDRRQDDPADQVALTAVLNTFLESLNVKDRSIFLRRYWYGDTIAELAHRFSMGQSAVKIRLFRMRQKLKIYLEQEGYEV